MENWKKILSSKYKDDFSESKLNHFDRISLNKKVIELDRKQPEFTLTFEKYLSNILVKKIRTNQSKIQ